MNGTNANTGKPLAGIDHLAQSIRDVLITPIGSRVLNREYGSRLFELIDAPASPALEVDIYAETAIALNRWLLDSNGNPRITVNSVQIASRLQGKLLLDLYVTDNETGEQNLIEGVAIA